MVFNWIITDQISGNILNNNSKVILIDGIKSFVFSGAISGILSTFVFTIIHHIFIVNIWFSFPIMAVAGIICGIGISVSYKLLFDSPTISSWLKYNSIFLIMFILLGTFSILYYDPITTVAAVMAKNDSPAELITKALPITIIFTLSFSLFVCKLYGRSFLHYVTIFLTCTILMTALGLNISILGLVEIPTNSIILVLELFGLIITILLVFAAVLIIIERKRFLIK